MSPFFDDLPSKIKYGEWGKGNENPISLNVI